MWQNFWLPVMCPRHAIATLQNLKNNFFKKIKNKSTSCKQGFFSISWGRWIGKPPQVNLAKFGYMWKREVMTCKNLLSRYGKFNLFSPPWNVVNLEDVFHTKKSFVAKFCLEKSTTCDLKSMNNSKIWWLNKVWRINIH